MTKVEKWISNYLKTNTFFQETCIFIYGYRASKTPYNLDRPN